MTTFGGFFPILLQLTPAVKITKEKGGSGRRGSVAGQNGVRFHELWEEKISGPLPPNIARIANTPINRLQQLFEERRTFHTATAGNPDGFPRG